MIRFLKPLATAAALVLTACTPMVTTTPTPSPGGMSTPTTSPATTSAATTTPQPSGTPVPADLVGTHDVFVTAFDDATGLISFDRVALLTGADAIEYATTQPMFWDRLDCNGQPYAGGDATGCSIANDYLIANDEEQTETLRVDGDAVFKLVDWDACCEPAPVGPEAFAARAAEQEMPLLASLTVRSAGTVSDVTEIYTP